MKTLKTTNKCVGLFAAVLLTFGGSALADNTKSDYDHNADFSQYHTYSWGGVKTTNPLYVSRIRDEVNKELQAKGWQMVPNGGSTTVFATGQVHNEKQLQTMYNGFGPGWGGGWGWGGWGWGGGGGLGEETTTTTKQPVANVVIDIFASSDKKLLWRGILTRDVSDNSGKNIKNVDKDIDKLFKDFPPKGKS